MQLEWQKAQQDPLKLLPLYEIPNIKPPADTVNPNLKKRKKKSRNGFVRFLQKLVYYKPTTFIGVTIMTAVLTALVQNAMLKPATLHKPRPKENVTERQPNIFNDNTLFTATDVNAFIKPLITALIQNDETNRVAICENCGDVLQFKTTSGKPVQATCLTCQKPFVDITSVAEQNVKQ